jgi:hypothetical protein
MENLIEAPSEVRLIDDNAACGMTSCDESAAIALRGRGAVRAAFYSGLHARD